VIEPLFVRCHAWSAAFRFCGVSSNSAHSAFGGYKQSGIGRETHKMMLEHYQQTKNLLVSYSPKKLGFF
jgi:acyl-CoA reductase-like NAD-dependent aldehyde dehydrogenase